MEFSNIKNDLKRLKFEHFSAISAFNHGKELGLTYHFIRNKKPVDYTITFDPNKTIPSVSDIFPSASMYETEAHEMFGVKFDKLVEKKLFLPDDWKQKPPLKK